MNLSDFSEQSRVWVYMANRKLNEEEAQRIERDALLFCADWSSHGSALKATAFVYLDYFVVFVVDETQKNASGCSIDKSVHFMKALERETGIHFFDRLKVLLQHANGELEIVPYRSLKDHSGAHYYDVTVGALGAFKSHFKVPVA